MAGTINYAYSPNQEVWVIVECDRHLAVESGVVVRVRSEVLVSGTTLQYDVRVGLSSGTSSFNQQDVFADLSTAIAEYQSRLS